jgi:hypothetical protein
VLEAIVRPGPEKLSELLADFEHRFPIAEGVSQAYLREVRGLKCDVHEIGASEAVSMSPLSSGTVVCSKM